MGRGPAHRTALIRPLLALAALLLLSGFTCSSPVRNVRLHFSGPLADTGSLQEGAGFLTFSVRINRPTHHVSYWIERGNQPQSQKQQAAAHLGNNDLKIYLLGLDQQPLPPGDDYRLVLEAYDDQGTRHGGSTILFSIPERSNAPAATSSRS